MRCSLALLLLPLHATVHAAVSGSPTTTTTTVGVLTCPSRTVNYITHSLPQQCLASTRKANITSTTTGPSSVPIANLPSSLLPSQGASNVSEVSNSSPGSTISNTTAIPTDRPTTVEQPLLTTPLSQTAPSATGSNGVDEESPLEDGKFLSFEDWKRENLIKSGQSEHVGKGPAIEGREPRKRAAIVQDSLDSFGDDAEIDLDFSGFVSDNLDPPAQGQRQTRRESHQSAGDTETGRSPSGIRSKDAGTTCKERFNYASFDCAANVLKTNPEAKSPSAVLGNNKDSYMLNECSAGNKFLILELCDDISIDTIVVANFEFFSSTFRTFRVSVSDKYPVKIDKWKTLGTFEARNSREVQAFLIENPVIWARYLRFEFLTHYGNEYYCPVSLVRVHGTTMLEEYKHDLESLQMEEEGKDAHLANEAMEEDGLVPEAVAEALLQKTTTPEALPEPIDTTSPAAPDEQRQPHTASTNSTQAASRTTFDHSSSISPTNSSAMFGPMPIENVTLGTCGGAQETNRPNSSMETNATTARVSQESFSGINKTQSTHSTGTTSNTATNSSSRVTKTSPTTFQDAKGQVDTGDNSTVTHNSSSATATNANSTKSSASSTQSPPPAPTMQESFFKSVQKRLQMLEANSSLSLQYIEEQSRALRDAFQKVEQRQLAKTTSFLDYLNTTVLHELREFRQQYDQLWQSTVIELEMQRERYEKENTAINARLGVLADEVIFQKRMSFLQLVLILICLGLVLFSKGSLNSYLELPLVQSVLSRSPSTRFMNASSMETPSQGSPLSRINSTGGVRKRQGILKGHRRFPSEDSIEATLSPSDLYTPPTPVSFDGASSSGEEKDDGAMLGDPQFDPSLIERPQTSPPALSGAESPTPPLSNGDVGDESIAGMLLGSPPNGMERHPPIVIVEDATPPPKHLKWQLPDS